MSTKGPAFLRARQPAQKQQRAEAILASARALALRDGLARVSLGGIAADVGLHKSALLTYFGTREEIFLRLAEGEWGEWGAAVAAELADAPAGDTPAQVAEALARSLADRPLLCELLLHAPLTLERNVSLDAVRRFKAATTSALDDAGDALHARLPALSRAACHELLMAGGLVAGGLWQASRPSPVVQELYADPAVAPGLARYAVVDFADALARFVRVHLAGIVEVDGPAG